MVTGYALAPEAGAASLYELAGVGEGITSVIADLSDAATLSATLASAQPEIVIHMAAQSLVRRSYRHPIDTLVTNVIGTALLLEAARTVASVKAIVVVTSDKCYENDGTGTPYTESHAMGGHDVYSASKGCTELVAAAYRRSFLAAGGVSVSTARAGNVIGGGDWAEDRLIPDLMVTAAEGGITELRNPAATRPWQFVLEPLRGYLMLAKAQIEQGEQFADGWNFGPEPRDAVPVREVARRMRVSWERVRVSESPIKPELHEAETLVLDCTKARTELGWVPALTLDDALRLTTDWYRAYAADPGSMRALVGRQLREYEKAVQRIGGV